MHYKKASDTLKDKAGICVNHSRLFVALCRALLIPSRTVSGACTNDKNFYTHHEWVEFYDDNDYWHVLDPTFTTEWNFTDLKRVDMIYDIETNPFYPFELGWEKNRVILKNGDISIFCPDWLIQQRTGGMSFKMLEDNSPYNVEIGIEYEAIKFLYLL